MEIAGGVQGRTDNRTAASELNNANRLSDGGGC